MLLATITVNDTADVVDLLDDVVTLREAIQIANGTLDPAGLSPGAQGQISGDVTLGAPADTITLPAGTYLLTIAGSGEDLAATGDLDIRDDLTIVGAGSGTTIIDGGGLDRIIEIPRLAFGSEPDLIAISGVTIRNGRVTDPGANGGAIQNLRSQLLRLHDVVVRDSFADNGGGGIANFEGLEITDGLITGNTAGTAGSPAFGGAIRNNGTAVLTNTIISNNTAFGEAGGITSFGPLTLDGVTVQDNTAGSGGGGLVARNPLTISNSTITDNQLTESSADGGGIMTFDAVTITNSTIGNNSAPDEGGGIFAFAEVTLVGSTVSGNTARHGGGIYNIGSALKLTNSTVSGNTALGNGGGLFSSFRGMDLLNVTITGNTADSNGEEEAGGGGIFTDEFLGGGLPRLRNTILAGNIDVGGQAPDGAGTLTSLGFNLIGSTAGLTLVNDTTGNILGQAPLLGPLADNGGPTQTHALLPGSPAIDAADTAAAPPTDQRGVARPQGTAADIGAFELEPDQEPAAADLSIALAGTPDPVGVADLLTYTITVSNAGPDAASGVMVTDTLPSGVTFVSATGEVTPVDGVLSFDLGTLGVGESATITIVVRPDPASAGTTIVSTAIVAAAEGDPEPSNNEAVLSTDVAPAAPVEADLVVTKTASADRVTVGEELTYTITVSNAGPNDADGVVLADFLPEGMVLVSAATSQGVVSMADDVHAVTATLGTLTAGGPAATVTLVVRPTSPGVLTNLVGTGSAAVVDSDTTNNTATRVVTVVAVDPEPEPDPDTAGPTVTDLRRLGVHFEPTRLVLGFSEPLDPSRAEDPGNYTLLGPGRDHRFGTRDDRSLALQSIRFDPATNTVTLSPRHRLPLDLPLRLVVDGSTATGLTDRAGNRLDGDGDGQPGGDFDRTFRSRQILASRAPIGTSPANPPIGGVPRGPMGHAVTPHQLLQSLTDQLQESGGAAGPIAEEVDGFLASKGLSDRLRLRGFLLRRLGA